MNKYLVEFAGTFFLMFIILTLGEALPIGLALTIAIMLGEKISGGHFNPAVSIAMFIGKKISHRDTILYILSQVIGAASALELVKHVK